MEEWIFAICEINPMLETLAYKAERAATIKAKRSGNNTMKEVNEVLRLINKKNAYFNLRVIYNSMMDALSERESDVLSLSSSGVSVIEIASRLGIQRTSVYKILGRAIDKCRKEIKELGYDENELKKEFLFLSEIESILNKNDKKKDTNRFVLFGEKKRAF